jgi:hypothetical protein
MLAKSGVSRQHRLKRDRERLVNQMSVPTADDIIAKATQQTGWGGGVDADLRVGLERTLRGFAGAPLTETARAAAIDATLADLVMRFRIEQFLADNPEIEQQEIEGPLFVTSVPRSGTTATLAMLALDPRFRFTRDWEIRQPLPPPVWGEEESDPRAVAARKKAGLIDQSIHLSDPDGPEEDLIALAGYDMRQYHGRYPMPMEYLDEYIEDSFRSMYRFHEKALKLLQWKRPPNHWLLKSPPHLFRFEAIVEQYPGSTIVMTHRDPVRMIASVSSMYEMIYGMVCPPDAVDNASIGRRCLDFWARGMEIALRARDKLGEDRFADVHNRELVADPVGTLEKLYDRLGYVMDEGTRERILDYNRRNAKGAHGEHKYTVEKYGLTEAEINAAFAEYNERFGL